MAEIGTILGGRYRLVELLGQGGMARIYRGHDNQLDRDVAVKVLRPEYGRDPDFGSRFRQEAQNAASLNHPNIVAVYDYGQGEIGPFIVMELVDGEDLASIIRRSGPLPPRQAARIAAETARALQAAHSRGIVHRDVKPGNVMINRDGQVKVTDFGIARAVAEAQMTLPGTTLGSVHYFSPEQARGDQATAASDIYSLGIVLFELLTGRRPWEADSAAAVAMARLAGPPPDPSTLRSGLPADLVAIDRKALATEPSDRWSSASSMAAALEAFLAGNAVPGVTGLGRATDATIPGSGPAAAAAALGAAAGTSATARANPNAIPYAPEAYADPVDRGAGPGSRDAIAARTPAGDRARRAARSPQEEDGRDGTSPVVWVAGIVAILILAAIGFLVFRLLSGPSTPAPAQVTVPSFVGQDLAAAQAAAARAGISIAVTGSAPSSGAAVNSILTQDPAPGARIDKGGTVNVTVVAGAATVVVPDLRNLSETDAFNALATAGLTLGPKTEAFDPTVVAGTVISQNPPAGVVVNKGTPVAYVLSKGPEPSPSPSPSPSPTPTPTPAPTPTPTPPPTPPPTPAPIIVGDYRCMTVGDAKNQIAADGFVAKVLPSSAGDDFFVTGQSPDAGSSAPPGSTVTISAEATKPADCP